MSTSNIDDKSVSRATLWFSIYITFMLSVLVGAVFMSAIDKKPDVLPCHYGASPAMVIEADGTARVVCTCKR